MKLLGLVSILLSIGGNETTLSTLTFDEAVALAAQRSSRSIAVPYSAEIAALNRSRLPSVRAELLANASRTLDLFAEGPLETRYATTVLAFDYPLWDGGANRLRIAALEARLRRYAASRGRLDDLRFMQLIDALGELYSAQRQIALMSPLAQQLTQDVDNSAQLLSSGEISNLMAADRREIALAFQSRLLEIEARRLGAATTLRLITGLTEEPIVVLDLEEMSSRASARDLGERAAPTPPDPSLPLGMTYRDDAVDLANIAVEESRARLLQVRATSDFRATLSGFVGLGTAQSDFNDVESSGAFGVYGLRVHLSYPLLRASAGIPVIEARAELDQSMAVRELAADAARARALDLQLREETARNRIALLQQSVNIAKDREDSLQRLARAGMRSAGDLGYAQAERVRREGELLNAQIDRWKASRLLSRMTEQP